MRSFSDSLLVDDQFDAMAISDYLGSSVIDIQNSRDDWSMNDDDDEDDFNIDVDLDEDFDDDDDWEEDDIDDDDDDSF